MTLCPDLNSNDDGRIKQRRSLTKKLCLNVKMRAGKISKRINRQNQKNPAAMHPPNS
jgi:hypothetical protein